MHITTSNQHEIGEPYLNPFTTNTSVATLNDSHLPTPQSTGLNSVMPFFPGVIAPPESPLAYTHLRTLGGIVRASSVSSHGHRSLSPLNDVSQSQRPLMLPCTVTPDSSPAGPSRSRNTTVLHRPSSAPLLPTKANKKSVSTQPELTATATVSTDHSLATATSPPEPLTSDTMLSNLSSPFVEKMHIAGDPNMSSPGPSSFTSESLIATPQPKLPIVDKLSFLSPIQPLDSRSTESGKNATTVLLTEPFEPRDAKPRVVGGELARIRDEIALQKNARVSELENRRPQYLKRLKREDAVELVDVVNGDVESDVIGILTSPVKGRRLQLFDFQETSAESFEESLMTYGYGTYGEPRTPQRHVSSLDGRSEEAVKWLTYNTPVSAVVKSTPPPLDELVEPSEKELRKRKRMQAFMGNPAPSSGRLYAVNIEGKGRLLLNVPPEDVDEIIGTPPKKRAGGRKKKTAAEKKGKGAIRRNPVVQKASDSPNWLDDELPWALRDKERREAEQAENAEKMRQIERYFARDTDSEDDDENDRDNDEEVLPSYTWGQEFEDPPVASRRGRGKAVPLQADPIRTPQFGAVENGLGEKMKALYFPSDPADARAALLSKRSVRLLAQRRSGRVQVHKPKQKRSEGRLACDCGISNYNDRPSVQCDKCFNWYHLKCIGIKNVAELGGEDDPWYCLHCRPSRNASPDAQSPIQNARIYQQPTFAPTDDRPTRLFARDDVAFFSSSPQLSPTARYWGSTDALSSPLHHVRQRPRDSMHARHSSWEDTMHGGPSTPLTSARNVRIFTPTTGRYDEYSTEDLSVSAFDPTTTPSRSSGAGVIKLGLPFTPKGSGGSGWASRASGTFVTPRGTASRHPTFGSQDETGILGAQFRYPLYGIDDTPIRRAPARDHDILRPLGHGRPILDSPLGARSSGFPSFSVLESPVERRRGSAIVGGGEVNDPPSPFDFQPES